MSTLVRRIGMTSVFALNNTRNALALSDGSSVVVIGDQNAAGAPSTFGDATGVAKAYVYHSTDRENWILRATLAMPVWGKITANIAPDNTVGIAILGTDKTIRYASVSAAWAASAWATVHTALASNLSQSDIDLTHTTSGVPIIFAARVNTTANPRLSAMAFIRRTSDSTWITASMGVINTPVKSSFTVITGVCLNSTDATARNIVFALGGGTATKDEGVRLYTMTVNESNGTFSGATFREAYGSGGVPINSVAVSARNAMLFQSDDNEYTLGIMHHEGNRSIGVTRGTFIGGNWVKTIPYITTATAAQIKSVQYMLTMTYSSDRMVFHYGVGAGDLVAFYAVVDSDSSSVTFTPYRWWDNKSKTPCIAILGGTGANTEWPQHDMIMLHRESSTKHVFYHHYLRPTPPPQAVVPSAGSVTNSSTPTLRAAADLNIQYSQTRVRMRWQIASDISFTTNLKEFDQDRSKMVVVDNTHLPNTFVPIQDVLDPDFTLTQGTWFIRAAHVNEVDEAGEYSIPQQFTVSHPPAAASLRPASGQGLLFNGKVNASWVFTDPSPTDTQSAYQHVVERNSDGAVVYDSGKVISKVAASEATVSTTYKNTELRHKVRLWDSDDAVGDYSQYSYFLTADAPTVTITSIVNGQNLTTAVPAITALVDMGGERVITAGRIYISKAGVIVHASPVIPLNLFTGESFTYVPPVELLANTTSYTFQAIAVDSLGITGTSAPITATTNWTPPAPAGGLAVDVASYNTEGIGAVILTWNDSARDADFVAWNVWRRVDYIHPSTGALLEQGVWVKMAAVSNVETTYTFKDMFSPSGYRVYYKIEQEVVRFGDVVVSDSAVPVVVHPISNSYWVIQPDTGEAFQLGNVTGDSYTEEYEEDESLIIGRGRHIDFGERLGYKGSLDAQVRDSNSVTARQKKLRLEKIKRDNRKLFMRNPFGDVFRVSVSNMSITRIAGVGLSEFFDITIPYSEVGE